MDQKQVKTILDWPIPKSVKEVESFLGFANFYRRFVLHYLRRVGNLTKLTHKDARFLPFTWNAAAQLDFDALKAAMSTAPVLAHFVPGRRTVLKADACEYALGAIVSQFDKEGVLHACGSALRNMSPAKDNYPIHDKELLGIVWALHKWHSIFLLVHGAFDVVTNHDELKHFMISKLLTRRQARWAEFLADIDSTVFYCPGRISTRPNTLSRRVDVYLSGREGAYKRNNPHNVRALISQSTLNPWTAAPTAPEVRASIGIFQLARLAPFQEARPPQEARLQAIMVDVDALMTEVVCAQKDNKELSKIRNLLRNGGGDAHHLPRNYSMNADVLRWDGVMVIPAQGYTKLKLDILRSRHDSVAAGHCRRDKTYCLVCRDYYWRGMTDYVNRYINKCHECARNKTKRHLKHGKLSPLPIPKRPFASLSMDHIVKLLKPGAQGYNCILVCGRPLHQDGAFHPHTGDQHLRRPGQDLHPALYCAHGLPDNVVSDRGATFTSTF